MFGDPDYATIVIDTEGNNFVFDDRIEAEVEASDCQESKPREVD